MRKKLFLLPILMVALIACGEKDGSDSEPNSTVNSSPINNSTSVGVGTSSSQEGTSSISLGSSSSVNLGNSSSASQGSSSSVSVAQVVYNTIPEVRAKAMAQKSGEYTDVGFRVKGTVTGIMGRSFHIQSGSVAIYVYNNTQAADYIPSPAGLAVGKVVEVFGPATQYLGLAQISSTAKVRLTMQILDETAEEIVPLEITSWKAAELEGMSSRLVKISNMRYVSGINEKLTESYRDIKFSLNGVSINLAVDKTNSDTEKAAIKIKLQGFNTVTPITYIGNLGWYNTPNMMICTAADLSI